jgi:uncharacterized protein (DUF2126 family)
MKHIFSCVRPPINIHRGFLETNANQISHESVPRTKIIKFWAVKGKPQWRGSLLFASHTDEERTNQMYDE